MQHGVVGVFDSGVGGLSVLRHIRALLPTERLLYVADTAHMPYGSKTTEEVTERALAIAKFMTVRGAKAMVVACNTATAAAISALRMRYIVPVIGMEPGLKPAAAISAAGIVGVLATPGTLASEKFAALLQQHHGGAQIIMQPCPGLVEQIERGDIDGLHTRALVHRYVAPLLARGVDTLVLGCTHYPFVEKLIREAAGPTVKLVETGAAVARELKRRLIQSQLLASESSPTDVEEFWTSGEPHQVAPVMAALWGHAVEVQQLPAE